MSLRLRITLVVVLVVTAVVAVVGQRVYASAERELVARCKTPPPKGSSSVGVRGRSSTRRPGTTSPGWWRRMVR